MARERKLSKAEEAEVLRATDMVSDKEYKKRKKAL